MKRNIICFCGILILALVNFSCKKDNVEGGLKSVFSYVADGFKVTFTNFSTGAKEYSWDFGDGSGEISTKKAPQHIFKTKGDFLVTLTATNNGQTSSFTDTVSIIGPNIKIDGDFSDWQYVDYAHVNDETYVGSIRAIKAFASSDAVYFYVEGNDDMNMAIMDLYIDSDNDPNTGFATWMYPAGSGADFLCEGSPVGGWGDVFKHKGAPGDFAWDAIASFGDAMHFSDLKTEGGKKIMEFSIKKSVLAASKKYINFCIVESTSGWAEVGKIPEAAAPSSKFIAVQL